MEIHFFRRRGRDYRVLATTNRPGQCSLWSVSGMDEGDQVFLGMYVNGEIEESEGFLNPKDWMINVYGRQLIEAIRSKWHEYESCLRLQSGYNEKMKTGPKPDVASMKKVVAYRKKKLSFREIGRIMEKDPSLIHRWYKRSLTSYPQKARLSR